MNVNGDIGDHSHMNALPLHSKLTDTFPEKILFPTLLLKFFVKNPKEQGKLHNAQASSGGGPSHHLRIW